METILSFKKDLDSYSTKSLQSIQRHLGLPILSNDDLVWVIAIHQAQSFQKAKMPNLNTVTDVITELDRAEDEVDVEDAEGYYNAEGYETKWEEYTKKLEQELDRAEDEEAYWKAALDFEDSQIHYNAEGQYEEEDAEGQYEEEDAEGYYGEDAEGYYDEEGEGYYGEEGEDAEGYYDEEGPDDSQPLLVVPKRFDVKYIENLFKNAEQLSDNNIKVLAKVTIDPEYNGWWHFITNGDDGELYAIALDDTTDQRLMDELIKVHDAYIDERIFTNNEVQTPLSIAIGNKLWTKVQYLLHNGADPDTEIHLDSMGRYIKVRDIEDPLWQSILDEYENGPKTKSANKR